MSRPQSTLFSILGSLAAFYNRFVRLFFCLELPAEVRRALADVAKRCQKALGEGNWVPEENYHLTVRFLGEVEDGKLPELLKLGADVAKKIPPFSLTLDVLGGFPAPKRARVLWVGPKEKSPEFLRLVELTEEFLQRLGFPPEEKEALPHVTLARFKIPRDLSAVLGKEVPAIPRVEVESLTLMRSELRPEGARYTPVSRWPLGGQNAL